MNQSATVGTELSKYRLAREQLLLEYPSIDDETLDDTLEGITDLHEMIAAVIRSALVDEALHAGLRGRLDDMKERMSRLELRATKKRELALQAMSEAGLGLRTVSGGAVAVEPAGKGRIHLVVLPEQAHFDTAPPLMLRKRPADPAGPVAATPA